MKRIDAKNKAKALLDKLTKGKVSKILLKLDAYSKPLPRDIPKDSKFQSCWGVFFSILLYIILGAVCSWFVEEIQSAGISIDNAAAGDDATSDFEAQPKIESSSSESCVPKYPHQHSEYDEIVIPGYYYPESDW